MALGVEEKKSITNFSANIYSHKQMLSETYGLLANKSLDENTRNLLLDLSKQENQDALDWKFQIEQHIKCELNIADRSIKLRARIRMAIIGSRGLLDWLLIADDEFVEKLMIASGMLAEKALADHLTRLCSDEHLHVVQMKREVLGMEGWEMGMVAGSTT